MFIIIRSKYGRKTIFICSAGNLLPLVSQAAIMASTEETVSAAVGDSTYPLADGELEQEINADFLAHDNNPPPKKIEKETGEAERKEDKDGKDKLKSTLLFSAAVVAVVGAIFALAKKIKEA